MLEKPGEKNQPSAGSEGEEPRVEPTPGEGDEPAAPPPETPPSEGPAPAEGTPPEPAPTIEGLQAQLADSEAALKKLETDKRSENIRILKSQERDRRDEETHKMVRHIMERRRDEGDEAAGTTLTELDEGRTVAQADEAFSTARNSAFTAIKEAAEAIGLKTDDSNLKEAWNHPEFANVRLFFQQGLAPLEKGGSPSYFADAEKEARRVAVKVLREQAKTRDSTREKDIADARKAALEQAGHLDIDHGPGTGTTGGDWRALKPVDKIARGLQKRREQAGS